MTAPEAQSTERLRRLQAVADAALAHLELDALLEEVLERVADALEVDTVALLVLDEERNELVARAARGLEEEVDRGVRIPVGAGFAGKIAAERRPVVIDRVDHSNVLNPILRERGVKSLLGSPLIVEGRVIGVVHVGSLTGRRFTEEDVAFLQLAADRIAPALEHARLYAAEHATAERLRKLQSITDAALAHLTLDDLLEELLPRVRDAFAADTVAVLLLDDNRRELVARAARGLEEEVERGVRIPLGAGFAGTIAAERRPIALHRVDATTVVNPILIEKGIQALLGAPLLARDSVVGVLHVGTLRKREFTQDDVELLQLAATRLGLAIERAIVHDQLRQLDRVRHAFVSVASHELRTPTAALYGAALTLQSRRDSLEKSQSDALIDVVSGQAQRLAALIEQLLDLSRLDARAVEIKPQPVRVRAQLEAIVEALAADQRARVEVKASDELEIIADPVALDRVLGNLIINALRHGAPPVRVCADKRDRHVRISVADNGSGVPALERARIFEPFVRSDESSVSGGTGLGLAIARSYAHAHGGDLVYDDDYSGGAKFTLILPTGRDAIRRST